MTDNDDMTPSPLFAAGWFAYCVLVVAAVVALAPVVIVGGLAVMVLYYTIEYLKG